MSRRGLWRRCRSRATCCGACWTLSTGPTRAALDRGITRGAPDGTGGDMSVTVLSTNRPHLARQARLEWDPVRKRQVLLAPEGVLVLNQTGAAILGLCDGERTVVEIVEELRGQYNRVAGDEVRDFLARLVAKRWVELGDE